MNQSFKSVPIIQNTAPVSIVSWLLVAAIIIVAVLQGSHSSDFAVQNGPSMMVVPLVLLTVIHGAQRYGWRDIIVFIAVVFAVGNFYENLSIATTFPFGPYHYTDQLGPKLIFTPLIINIAYFQIIYLGWNLAAVLLDKYENRLQGGMLIALPVVATFVTVLWDVAMDPFMSTYSGNWIWHEGGSFFGVPLQNYVGWYLCVYTMFQLFAIWTTRAKCPGIQPIVTSKSSWAQLLLAYFSWPLVYCLMPIFYADQTIEALNGQSWQLTDLLQTGALISFSTMGFVGVLVAIKIYFMKTLPPAAPPSRLAIWHGQPKG